MMKRIGLIAGVLVVLVALSFSNGSAQKFPAKDITLIVPWAAGG